MSDIERVERLLKDYDRDARPFERFGAEVERLLKAILKAPTIQISSITHRLKERDSFVSKIKSSVKYGTARSVTDLVER